MPRLCRGEPACHRRAQEDGIWSIVTHTGLAGSSGKKAWEFSHRSQHPLLCQSRAGKGEEMALEDTVYYTGLATYPYFLMSMMPLTARDASLRKEKHCRN